MAKMSDTAVSGKNLEEIARCELNETPDKKREGLSQLRQLISGAWNTSICSMNDAWRLHLLYFEHLLLQDECQIMGLILVLDLKGLGIHHVFQFTPSVMRNIFHFLQNCYPVRLKGVYIVNNPAVFDIIFSVVKPFLKAKFLQRIHVFGDDYENMRAVVPDDLIPEAKGGTHESYDYDKMARDLGPCEEFIRDIKSYGCRQAT